MRVEILRNVGTDLELMLAQRPGGPGAIPDDLHEGQVTDLADPIADALIAFGVAAKTDKQCGPGPGRHDKPDKTPAGGHPAVGAAPAPPPEGAARNAGGRADHRPGK